MSWQSERMIGILHLNNTQTFVDAVHHRNKNPSHTYWASTESIVKHKDRDKKTILRAIMFYVWIAVAFGNDGDDEHQRMPEHRQRDCHQLRTVQHHAAADEAAGAESRGSRYHQRPAKHYKNAVQK